MMRLTQTRKLDLAAAQPSIPVSVPRDRRARRRDRWEHDADDVENLATIITRALNASDGVEWVAVTRGGLKVRTVSGWEFEVTVRPVQP